jgi:hypothetical protein
MSSTYPAATAAATNETFTYREPNKDATETATHVKKDDGTFEVAPPGTPATHVKVNSAGIVVGGRRSPRSSRRGGSRASKRGGRRGGRRSNKRGGKRASRRGGSRASRR